MKIYNGNNLVGEVKELTKENFNKYFSMNFTEYQNNYGYNIGDYVVYEGELYKCIKTITVSEEFNPSKWEKVYGFNNISSLKIENDKLYITFENGESKEIKNFSLTNALNQQVEYGQFGFDNTIEGLSTIDTLVPFKTKLGNIELNSDGTITLKANKTYKLSCYFRISDTDALKSLSVKQNETFLFNVVAKASETTETCTSVYIFTPTIDAKVGLYTSSFSSQIPTLTSSAFYSNTKLIVEEIAQPVINNVNYTLDDINNQTNIEDTPIGHIISFMGTKAPDHYLVCDGSIYNISDYQKLADFINDQFGSYNYFGGNGTTTFAVPDLRNEFIRGYHGTSSEQLSGDIGKHQDGSEVPYIFSTSSGNINIPNETISFSNVDKTINSDSTTRAYVDFTSTYDNKDTPESTTLRPTNVAVLFCIKYENTYYVNVTNNNTYKETVLYENSIPIVSTLDNLDTTKYATTDSPMELTLDEDLSQYDRLEIVLGTVTYSGNNYWIPINDKINGKGNENIYYRNCLMVDNNSYCSVQLDYHYTDKQIILRSHGMSSYNIKGATILKVIGIKY